MSLSVIHFAVVPGWILKLVYSSFWAFGGCEFVIVQVNIILEEFIEKIKSESIKIDNASIGCF